MERSDRLLSVKETANVIGLSKDTIYGKISPKRQKGERPVKCEIPRFRRNGRRILFLESDVQAFVKGAVNGSEVRG